MRVMVMLLLLVRIPEPDLCTGYDNPSGDG